MGRYIRGSIDEDLQLGTLASKTVASGLWDETVNERTLISSIVCSWSLDGITSPQGPIMFGVAHGDYTAAEIEQVIENTGSWNEGDKVNQEISKRQVRMIGILEQGGGGSGVIEDYGFNVGKPMKTKLNWILNQGQTIRMWAYNLSGSALSATDPAMRANGHANLWPR